MPLPRASDRTVPRARPSASNRTIERAHSARTLTRSGNQARAARRQPRRRAGCGRRRRSWLASAYSEVPAGRGGVRQITSGTTSTSPPPAVRSPSPSACSNGDRVVGSTRFMDLEVFVWPPPWPPGVTSGPAPTDDRPPSGRRDRRAPGTPPRCSGRSSTPSASCCCCRTPSTTWGVLRVTLKTDSRNARSRAAILRIGATFEGHPSGPRAGGRRWRPRHRLLLDHRRRVARSPRPALGVARFGAACLNDCRLLAGRKARPLQSQQQRLDQQRLVGVARQPGGGGVDLSDTPPTSSVIRREEGCSPSRRAR